MSCTTLSESLRSSWLSSRTTVLLESVLSLVLWASLPACGWGQLRAENEKLRESNVGLQQQVADLQIKLKELSAHVENVERSVWSDRYCKTSKNSEYSTKIAEFIGQLQARIPGTCQADNLATSLIFMNNEPYMVAIFRPDSRVEDLHMSRFGYLKTKLLAPKYIRPSTRVIVLVQPAEESPAAQDAAMKMGAVYIKMLTKKFFPDGGPRILGPHLLPCRLTAEIRRLYKSDMDSPLPTEPREGTPQVKIFTFRSDC